MTERLLLVGMMGVGKTTIGTLSARQLGWSFLDSDAQLLHSTGDSAQEIFEADGDDALRTLESLVLVEALAQPTPSVIAVAGGVVLTAANRSLLTHAGVVVWLRATIETLSDRVQRGGARPRLGDDPTRSLRTLYRDRHPFYAAIADFVIDVDDLSAAEVVTRILAETGLGEAT
jgi:shikimate kinase